MDHTPKKVCLLNHGLASGGTDSFVITMAKGLQADGYEVLIALAVDPDSEPQYREDEITSLNIPIVKTSDLNGIRKVLCHCKRLYKLLKKEKPDVFHANMDLFNGLNMLVAWLADVPVRVCHSHNSQSQYEQNTGKHFAVGLYRSIMKRVLWIFSNRRIGCSKLAMNYLFDHRWEKDQHSHVVYNGVDFSRFSLEGFNREEKKKELQITAEKNIVVVARLAEMKNPGLALRIMQKLHEERPDVHLLWIGDGEIRGQVEKEIQDLQAEEYVHLLGVKRNVPDYLRCCDLYLMTSLFEGLPIATIEAQISGLPCVVADTVSDEVNIGGCKFLPLDSELSVWTQTITGILDGNLQLTVTPSLKQSFDKDSMVHSVESVYFQ